jgi:drug/metabolite transporter (DMT)-like permease
MALDRNGSLNASDRIANNAYFLLAIASLFWSGNHVLGRAIAGEAPPIGLAMLRWLLPAVFLWSFARPHLARDWPVIKRHWFLLFFLGVTGGSIFSAGQYIGLQYTTALNVSVLNSLTPVFILVTGALIFRDRLTAAQIGGILISFVGVLVIVSKLSIETIANLNFNIGDIVIVANMAIMAIYSSYLRLAPKMHWLSFIFLFAAISTVSALPFAVWEYAVGPRFHETWFVFFTVIYVAIFPSLISYAAWTRGVELIGPNRAGPFLHLTPLYSALLASVFLGEQLQAFHVLGFALILSGVFLASRQPSIDGGVH